MGHLPNYVDVKDYCKELASITDLDLKTVQNIVESAFAYIAAGVLSATRGFVFIERELYKEMEANENRVLAYPPLVS